VDKKVFECLSCGHFTAFNVTQRPRCAKCGGMTGIVDNDSESPRFRSREQAQPGSDKPPLRRRDH
jgi:hypothetical protein